MKVDEVIDQTKTVYTENQYVYVVDSVVVGCKGNCLPSLCHGN